MDMEKIILAAASFEKQKFYWNPEFVNIPMGIQDEIKVVCVVLAQKLNATFVTGFYDNGDIYFEIVKPEDVSDFDDIGAELEIKLLKKEKEELIKSLKLWYVIFRTKEGKAIKAEILEKSK